MSACCFAWSIALVFVFYSPCVFANDHDAKDTFVLTINEALVDKYDHNPAEPGSAIIAITNGRITIGSGVNDDGTFAEDTLVILEIYKIDSAALITFDGKEFDKGGLSSGSGAFQSVSYGNDGIYRAEL